MDNYDELKKSERWSQKTIAYSNVVLALASVVALLVTVLQREGAFPVWFFYIPPGLLFISVALLLRKPIKTFGKKLSQQIAARRHFPRLVVLISEMRPLLEYQRTNTITNALLSLQGDKDWLGTSICNTDFDQLCDNMLFNLDRRLQTCAGNLNDLASGLNDLMTLVSTCERVYFEQAFQKVRTKGVATIPDNHRASLNLARENFAAYIRQLLEYRKIVSVFAGSALANTYVEMPKPL